MKSILVCWVFLCFMISVVSGNETILNKIEDGTLLFVENSNKFVEFKTKSDYSHVAIVISDEKGDLWVYEAEPPRIKKMRIKEWLKEIAILNEKRKENVLVSILNPQEKYNEHEVNRMRVYLEGQVDRPYSIRSFIQKKSVKGAHCSEITSAALEKSERMLFDKQNYEITPVELLDLVVPWYRSFDTKFVIKLKNEDIQVESLTMLVDK